MSLRKKHNLIKDKLIPRIEKTFAKMGFKYLACNSRTAFFTDASQSKYTLLSCEDVCTSLEFLLDNIFVKFGNHIYRQNVGIPMGTNCAPLVADLFLFCYERDFMLSL